MRANRSNSSKVVLIRLLPLLNSPLEVESFSNYIIIVICGIRLLDSGLIAHTDDQKAVVAFRVSPQR